MPFLLLPFQEFDSLVTYMVTRNLLPDDTSDPNSLWGSTLVSVLLVAAACSGLGLLRILFCLFFSFPAHLVWISYLRLLSDVVEVIVDRKIRVVLGSYTIAIHPCMLTTFLDCPAFHMYLAMSVKAEGEQY
jgi:hypothetical protein